MNTTENYRQLGKAITYEAIREFIEKEDKPKEQAKIIRQLRSGYMDLISGGLSVILAEKLETNPEPICARVRKEEEERKKNDYRN